MTDKQKLDAIQSLLFMHIGDKHSLCDEIEKILSTKKKKKESNNEFPFAEINWEE